MFKSVREVLDYADRHELYPDLRIIEGGAEPEVFVDERKVLMFASNNYLGFATHPTLINTAIEATKKYGVGSDGSRLLSGNLQIHRNFEKAIADFEGGEDALVWPTGYSANVGVISALMNPPKVSLGRFFSRGPIVLSDELNHASIIDGIKLSGAQKSIYKHCDLSDLESKLKTYRSREKLVVTDSVFSMDGDLVRYLRVGSRSYMFSTAMTPAASATLIKTLELIDTEPERREQLIKSAKYVRERFHEIGYNTCGSQTQIMPILIGKDEDSVNFSRKIFERGIYGPAVRWPAVPKGKARIRFTIMATHTKDQLDKLIKVCAEVGKELRII